MIRSMTGFARAEVQADGWVAVAEVRSVNHRYCEILVRLPPPFVPLEERVKRAVRRHVERGRVEVSIGLRDERQSPDRFEVNLPLARSYYNVLVRLKESLGLEGTIDVQKLARVDGVVRPASPGSDLEAQWGVMEASLERAMETLGAMRLAEGQALCQDLCLRLGALENYLDSIAMEAREVPALCQKRLLDRVRTLLEGSVEPDPARLAQEAAFFADKADVNEEIVRLRSHLHQFRQIMETQAPAGRSLNFMVQELLREYNTIGSKAQTAALSHLVVAAKSEVEKLREQVQNVE